MLDIRQFLLLALPTCALLFPSPAQAQNWPQWRGPNGNGVSEEKNLPIAWNEHRGIQWKCPLPGWGASTPVIWNDAVFVTSHAGERLLLLRIDRKTGDVVWEREAGKAATPRAAQRGTHAFHDSHNLASPSPATNGEVVVAHFGNGLLVCYDFDGNELWKRNLQDDHGPYTNWWGRASSPVIYRGSVISVCMQDSLADLDRPEAASYVVSHDLRDGHVRWFRERPTGAKGEEGDAYTTPLLHEANGFAQLIVWGGNQLDAYDPATGKPLWRLPKQIGGRTVTSPLIHRNLVVATKGMRGEMLGVQLGKDAEELTHRDIAWRSREGTPDCSTPVAWEDWLFFVSDNGIARCLHAESGNFKWKERLKGEYKASPIVAQGRVYFLNTTGLCTVISATQRFDRLIENQLDDETIASPVASQGEIFIRGKNHLYCIGK